MSGGAILVVGDTMTDIIVRPDGPLLRGSDRRARIVARPGGSAANQAVWLAEFGADVRFLGRVAMEDLDARTAYFRSRGVTPLLAGDPESASGTLIALVDSGGERSFLTDRGANLNLGEADVPADALDGVSMLLCSGYAFFAPGPRGAAQHLMGLARVRGIATIIDAASVGFLREVGAGAFLKWTAGAGTIFANAEEAVELTGSTDPGLQMQTLGRFYPRVIVKRGAAGAAIGGRTGVMLSLPAPQSDVIDTTGAGDAFAAAFLAAELDGADTPACLEAAIAAGATAVTLVGGQPDRGLLKPTR